jgi:hypothetical protein
MIDDDAEGIGVEDSEGSCLEEATELKGRSD